MTTTIELGRRAEDTYDRLRRDIERGHFKVEQRLPAAQALADRYGVSRTPVNQALSKLEEDGRLVRHGRRGYYVRSNPVTEQVASEVAVMYNHRPDTMHAVPKKLQFIQERLLGHGYLMTIYGQSEAHWDAQAERKFLDMVLMRQYRGLLAQCSPLEPRNDDVLASLNQAGVRVVHVEHYRVERPDENYLLPDYERAAHMAAMILMAAGYGPLYLLSRHDSISPFIKLQQVGFRQALSEHPHLAPTSAPNDSPLLEITDGYPTLLERLPAGAGVIGTNMECAKRLYDTAQSQGLSIPEDLGIIGIEIGDEPIESDCDALIFDRQSMLARAIKTICSPEEWPTMKEMILPTRLVRGSVRER